FRAGRTESPFGAHVEGHGSFPSFAVFGNGSEERWHFRLFVGIEILNTLQIASWRSQYSRVSVCLSPATGTSSLRFALSRISKNRLGSMIPIELPTRQFPISATLGHFRDLL